jgi:hypothetical protein
VLSALAAHVEAYGVGEDQVLFANPSGGLWRRGSFNDSAWKPALRRAGLPEGYGIYALRHTYASGLISAGLHPRVVQARLGHKSVVETMDTYGHLFPDQNEDTANALDAIFGTGIRGSDGVRILNRHGEVLRPVVTPPGTLLGTPVGTLAGTLDGTAVQRPSSGRDR